jgi:3,4-dihydroxy 2-butanone 4-phosphate synthase/GTP cyclohydrolase II
MDSIEALLEQIPLIAQKKCAETGNPLVTLSYAQSLDGSLTARRGQPLALSGPESMRLTHRLRAAHAAILVGIGTVLADDPRLNVRLVQGAQPTPVILDSALRTPPDARLFGGARQPWLVCAPNPDSERKNLLEQAGGRVLSLPVDAAGRIDPPALLNRLAQEGLSSMMVEGGASVIRAFLAQGLVDQAVITIAPLFVGGLPALGDGEALPVFPRFEEMRTQQLGDDLVVWGNIGKINSSSYSDLTE